MFDWRELRRWGIDERRLPAGSIVLFREPTLWSEYKWQISAAIALLVAQGLGSSALLVERRSRRRAQAGLVEAEQRYRTVADFTADWEFWKRPDGSLVYVSPSCLALTGYDAAAFLERPIAADRDHPRRRPGHLDERTASKPGHLAVPDPAEFRIRTRGGEIRWIDHVCSPVIGADGRDLGIRGSNRDITARKQSENELRRALDEIRELRDRLEIDNTYMREQLQPDSRHRGHRRHERRHALRRRPRSSRSRRRRARCCCSARPASARASSRRRSTT